MNRGMQKKSVSHKKSARKKFRLGFWRTRQRNSKGFTLTELIVASLIATFVIMLAWTGLFSVMNMSSEAQAVTARKLELTNALDLLTEEVREAKSINRSGDIIANGADVTLEDVVRQSGLGRDEIGNTGDLALFLEIPTNSEITACMTDKGPIPADTVDRVVYDVRESPVSWLPPEVVARYGRIPEADGSINPCSTPVANDIVADSIAAVDTAPSCDGVLSGGKGFHICQKGENIDLLLKSSISKVDDIPLEGSVTSRAVDFTPTPAPNMSSSWQLLLTKTSHHDVAYEWIWNGNSAQPAPPSIESYTVQYDETPNLKDTHISKHHTLSNKLLHRHHEASHEEGRATLPGSETRELEKMLDTLADNGHVCMALKAVTSDAQNLESNQVCF